MQDRQQNPQSPIYPRQQYPQSPSYQQDRQQYQQSPMYPPQSRAMQDRQQYSQYPQSSVLEGFDSQESDDPFEDKTIRQGFIRKVYTLLTVQLLVTSAIIAVFIYNKGVKQYVQERPALFWGVFIISIVLYLALVCCGDLRRNYPLNMICLAIFTLAEGVLLGIISARYRQETVFLAAVTTAVVTAGLTVFAFQTSCDFTMYGGVLCVASIIICVFGLVCVFFPGKTLVLIFSSVSALLFSIYIIYDTQMMMGGRKYSLSPDEYIFATLNLYMDIVLLFMHLMTILGILGDD